MWKASYRSWIFRPTVFVLTGCLMAVVAAGDDWPQFRGLKRDGACHEIGLAIPWGDAVPAEIWRVAVGPGFSGAAVAGERLFILGSRDGDEHVVCLDAASGHELWRTAVGPMFLEPAYGDGPRTTPTVEGSMLWALSAAGRLVALRVADGATLWSVDLPRADVPGPFFGFTSMPLLIGNQVVVELSGAPGNAVLAFDKRSGEQVWRTDAGMAGFSSPTYAAGQILLFNAGGLVSLSPVGGEILWRVPFDEHQARIAQPLFIPPDLILVSQGYDIGAMVTRLQPGVGAKRLWQDRRALRTLVSTSVAADGLVYGFDNSTLKCIDATTGEKRWAKRGGFGNGSLLWADGQLVVLTENGRILTVEATGEAYRETGAAVQVFSGRTWAPMALAGGRLFVRGPEELVALDLKPADASRRAAVLAGKADMPAAEVAATHSPPRDVAAIVARYVETLGGADAIAAIRSLRRRGHYVYNGERYPFTASYQRPGCYRFEAVRPDGDVLVLAHGGTTGWRRSSDGPRPFLAWQSPVARLPPTQLRLLLEGDADFEGPLVNYRSKGHRVELIGETRLPDDTRVDHLRLTLKSGSVQDWYLSRQDGTLVEKVIRIERDIRIPGVPRLGPYDRRWHYEEYRRVAGVRLPILYEREDSPFVRTFIIEDTEVNVEFDDEIFSPPPAAADGR